MVKIEAVPLMMLYTFIGASTNTFFFSTVGTTTAAAYGDVFMDNERQQSEANFHGYDVDGLKRRFEDMVSEVQRLLDMRGPQDQPLVLPAYDQVLKASHLFNLMDARGAIAVAERQSYIGRIRELCKACATAYVERERGEA